ncbi:MAG: hypothetical protein ACOX1X_00010 [Dethiobacteria bacterium]
MPSPLGSQKYARVDDYGVVLPVAVSNCTISAYAMDSGHAASCQVTVKDANARGYNDFPLDPSVGLDVDLNKSWGIRFNKGLNVDTVNKENIYICDAAGNVVPATG